MRSLTFATVLIASGLASASTPVAEEDVEEDDEYSEAAILKKKGIPLPPSQERKAYLAWRKKLPKGTQKKIARHCREYGGEYQQVCNGIGPYALPVPPSLMPEARSMKDTMATHASWEASLTPTQRRYYRRYCGLDRNSPYQGNEDHGFSQLCGGTPIVLAFGSERVAYTTGDALPTDWPTATTPWLARDLDGDGAITHGGELFGSSTALPDGSLARHGFEALAALDSNRDGVLDASDPAFASLVVWADRDGDRTSSPGELSPLSATVLSLSLAYRREAYCDARGNCEGERATLQWRDASGALRTGSAIDVYLRYR